jgi:hypothetical protein
MAAPYAILIETGGPDLIERGVEQSLAIKVYDKSTGQGAIITSGTMQLYYNGATAGTSGAVTVSSSNIGLVTRSVDSGEDDTLGAGYVAVWSLEISGTTYTFRRDYAMAAYLPKMVVSQDDLYARHPELRDQIPPNQTTWIPQIHEAFREITQRIADQGRRYWLIVSQGSPRLCHLYLTFAISFRLLSSTSDSRWTRLADQYQRMFDAEWEKLRFEYDADDNNASDGQEAAQAVVYLSSGPRRAAWR